MRDLELRGEPITKGRVSQLFDDNEPFGERAAISLAERIGLDREFFLRTDASTSPPPQHTDSAVATTVPEGLTPSSAPAERLADALGDALQGLPATLYDQSITACRRLAESPDSPRARAVLRDLLQQSAHKSVDQSGLGSPPAVSMDDQAYELHMLRDWQASVFSLAEHEPPNKRAVIAQFLLKVRQAQIERDEAHARSAAKAPLPASSTPPTKAR